MPPEERIAHGLPPKPPAPSRDRPDTRRDHRNKKKQDHQKGSRDNKSKDQSGNRRPSIHKQQRHNRRHSSQGQNLPKSSPPRTVQPQQDASRDDHSHEQTPTKSEHTTHSGEIGNVLDTIRVPEQPNDHAPEEVPEEILDQALEEVPDQTTEPLLVKEDPGEASDFEWEIDAIFREPESRHDPDEVGKPLPSTYNDGVLLPRKWDSKCIESEFIDLDNLEEFIRPIHETQYWEDIQFDAAFVRDGLLPSGDPLPRIRRANETSETTGAVHQKDQNDGQHSGGEHMAVERRQSHDGQIKRKRSPDPSPELRNQVHQDSPPRERRLSSHQRDRRSESYRSEPSRHDHRPRESFDRRESETRHRSPGSRRSSVSSASSHSSGLDSLDMELLGIEPKDKRQHEEDRGRQSDERAPKPKRRRVQLDSAYR